MLIKNNGYVPQPMSRIFPDLASFGISRFAISQRHFERSLSRRPASRRILIFSSLAVFISFPLGIVDDPEFYDGPDGHHTVFPGDLLPFGIRPAVIGDPYLID